MVDNMSLFGTENLDTVQEMYEEISRKRRKVNCSGSECGDTYEVEWEETLIDLANAGFVIIDGKVCRRG